MRLKAKRVAGLTLLALLAVGTSSWATYTYSNGSGDRISNKVAPSPFVSGYADEELRLNPDDGDVQIIRVNNKIHLNKYTPHLIPIENLSVEQARELRETVRAVVKMEGGNAQIVLDKKSPKKERFVYVVCPPFQWPYVQQAVKALDKKWVNATDDGSTLFVWEGRYRDIRDIQALTSFYSPNSFYEFHERDNVLTVVDFQALAGTAEKIARTVDIPVNEITVDAKFYEVTSNSDHKLGLDYITWKNGPGKDLFDLGWSHARSYYDVDNGSGSASVKTHSTSNHHGYDAYATASFVDFLESKGKATLLANGTIKTVSSQMGSLKSLEPIAMIQASGKNVETKQNEWDRFVNYTRDATKGQVGVFLNILPFVGAGSTEMYVGASISNVIGKTPVPSANGAATQPIISESSVVSQVRVRDGEKLVLAGLTRTEGIKQKQGAPWLGDLPVLGYVFGSETSVNRVRNVLVTLDVATVAGLVDSNSGAPLSLEDVAKIKGNEKLSDKERFNSMAPLSEKQLPNNAVAKGVLDARAQVADQVAEKAPLDIPAVTFGFDQWLLDPAKK
jgi:type II secretory pathway component GspD/PulD (secretin)